jgi:hypothetical protein
MCPTLVSPAFYKSVICDVPGGGEGRGGGGGVGWGGEVVISESGYQHS